MANLLCGPALILLILFHLAPAQAAAPPVEFQTIFRFAELANLAYEKPAKIRRALSSVERIATPGKTNVQYFLARDSQQQIVSVRGTVDDVNWDLDLDTVPVRDRKAGLLMHRGFNTVARTLYRDLHRRLSPALPVVLTGHSLGGAAAAILGVYLRLDGYSVRGIYTFGQPKFTDSGGARSLANLPLLRVIHQNDAVVFFPAKTKKNGRQLYAHMGAVLNLLTGPHYLSANSRQVLKAPPKIVRRVRRQLSVPDHKMKFYLRNLRYKLQGSKRIAFRDRVKYIDRKRLEPIRRVYNFGPHR